MKSLAVLIVLLSASLPLSAQKTKSDVFNSKAITWYGLDFSQVKLIGSAGFTDPVEVKNYYFNSWNQLFVSEREKYNLSEFFAKPTVDYNLEVVEARNKIPNADELVINENYMIDETRIPGIIKEYNTKEKEGIGLVFIIETFNKANETGTLYIVFFDIATKEPLLVKKMGGKPAGFGIRNFWAGCIYDVLKQCKKEYPKWMK